VYRTNRQAGVAAGLPAVDRLDGVPQYLPVLQQTVAKLRIGHIRYGNTAVNRQGRCAVGQYAVRSAAIPILGTCVLVGFAVWLQGALGWRVSLPALTVAAVLLATGLRSRGLRSHYVTAAAVLFTFSGLPLLGVGFSALDATFDAVIGVVLLITGMGDHRLLMETLQPPTEGLA
jgi:hypothetical protein